MKQKIVLAVAIVASVLLAAWGGYVFCTQVEIEGFKELYALIPTYVVLVLLCAVTEETIHEGAHYIVGAILRMGVKLPQIRFFRSSSVEINPKGVKGLRARFVLTAGAGLFFDLLLIVWGVVSFAVPSVSPIYVALLPYAVYTFILNAAPLEYSGGKTDGLVICEALSGNDSSKVMLAVLRVQGMVNAGLPLKEVDENLLTDVPQVQEDDINFIILTRLRYEYYVAKGDEANAQKYFDRYNEIAQYLPDEYKH